MIFANACLLFLARERRPMATAVRRTNSLLFRRMSSVSIVQGVSLSRRAEGDAVRAPEDDVSDVVTAGTVLLVEPDEVAEKRPFGRRINRFPDVLLFEKAVELRGRNRSHGKLRWPRFAMRRRGLPASSPAEITPL
jgi:hypothetical protein